MFGSHRFGVPGVGGAAGHHCARVGADLEACAAHRIPLSSAQDGTPLIPTAQSGPSTWRADRAADRDLGTPMDVPAARNVRCKRLVLAVLADSRRRCRALALSIRPQLLEAA